MARGTPPQERTPPRGLRAPPRVVSRLSRPVWRLLDPDVPRTQAIRRLRALALASAATLAANALVAAVAHEPSTDPAAATGASTTTTTPPMTIRPLTSMAPAGHAPVITRVETTDPVAFVTIDDGYVRAPEVADVLDELDLPVTLFLVDRPVLDGAGYFGSLPGAVAESHSRSHADLRGMPEDAQRAEICDNARTIAGSLGRTPVLFRPPYGNHDEATQRAAAACGMAAVVLWEQSVERGEMRFRSAREIRPGDIILLHFRPELPGELRMVADRVAAAGLRVARLEDYLVPDAP
jgi:peptidoglycan/xylan/chitin deacetylase (PgdA/CDA1 family)